MQPWQALLNRNTDLLPSREKLCQCPDCRRRRGETVADLDDDDQDDEDKPEFDDVGIEQMFKDALPKDMPPDLKQQFLEIMKEAILRGESPDEIMSRLFGGGGHRKKGQAQTTNANEILGVLANALAGPLISPVDQTTVSAEMISTISWPNGWPKNLKNNMA